MLTPMGMRGILIGVLVGVVLTSCARTRSAERLCEKATGITTTTSLVHTIGTPDRKSHGETSLDDVDRWGYDGADGVCIIPVANNVVGPHPTFLPYGPANHN
jgi:hypothetical protein